MGGNETRESYAAWRRRAQRQWRQQFALFGVALGALIGTPGVVVSQEPSVVVRDALDGYFVTLELEPDSAIQLLRRGLDPSGLPEAIWAEGVQSLVQILEENGLPAEARVWARWAIRRVPGLSLTSLNLGAQARSLFETARAALAVDTLIGAGTARHEWLWTPSAGPTAPGTIVLEILPEDVRGMAVVLGVGPSQPGGLPASAGVYDAVFAGPQFDSVRVRLEVLPGVTTRVTVTPALFVAVLADSELPPSIATTIATARVPVTATRFALPASCEWGLRVGSRLILTTYRAVRGAASIDVGQAGPTTIAQFDTAAGLVALGVAASRNDSLRAGGELSTGSNLWLVGVGCEATAFTRVRIATTSGEWAVLEEPAPLDAVGSLVVDRTGGVIGVLTATDTVTHTACESLVAEAHAAPRDLTPGQVAQMTNHILGALDISLAREGTVTVEPLEDWHWPGLRRSLTAAGAFVGPLGRYRLTLSDGGQVLWEQEVLIRPEETVPVRAGLLVAEQPRIDVPRRKKGFPIILVVLGAAGTAGGAALLLLGGGGGGGGGGGDGSGFGGLPIVITIP